MLRTVFLSLIVLICFSSATLLHKSLSRRQSGSQNCRAIEGFECQCSPDRVACTTDRDLPQALHISAQERGKYQTVELVINGQRDQNVYEHTFEPVKQLFKSDGDLLELRVKFEKFASLNLPASAFNRVFSDNTPATARKHLNFEIHEQNAQPNDDVSLFANLNVDSLELYVLYPFRGTFQQLFNGANIKNLRLSGGEIRSDLSQPFTGKIGRLELAKQGSELSAKNFPIYPAHELIINAYYVSEFTTDNPPNYSNLAELRVHSLGRIPANAFQSFPNLHTLSISTDNKDMDPHALAGLHKLEKLSIKDTKLSLDALSSVPGLKELEIDLKKLDDREQCQLIEKLANGQIAVQSSGGGQECTCASAYLDSASGRYVCDAGDCTESTCAAIRDNYDASTKSFKAPPAIQRLDGSDAFRPREQKVYSESYQISHQDREKSERGASSQPNQQRTDDRQDQGQSGHHYHPDANQGDTSTPAEGNDNREDGNENRQDGEDNVNQQAGDGHDHHTTSDPNQSPDAMSGDTTEGSPSTKRKLGWLPIIIIIAAVAGLLLIGLIILLVRRRRAAAGYNPAATSEHGGAAAARA